MSRTIPYRILALSGGGIRGIFQAAFLKKLAEKLPNGVPLHSYFDLIVGTSTGSIIGLATALGIETPIIYAMYAELGSKVFEQSIFSWFRKGGRYKPDELRRILTNVFRTKRLSDVKTGIVTTATSLDQYSHKVFYYSPGATAGDANLYVVDIAMASSAAPTFFPPVKPTNHERTYVDGGLWANNPSLLGILKVHKELNVPFEQMRVLSIGTGIFPNGLDPKKFSDARAVNPKLLTSVIDLFSNAQARFADEYSSLLIGEDNYVEINTNLAKVLKLHNVNAALKILPAQAEELAEKHAEKIEKLFSPTASQFFDLEIKRPNGIPVPQRIIEEAGLTGFYSSRADYAKLRKDASSIVTYISTARQTLTMVSINLMTGEQYEGIQSLLIEKLERFPQFRLTISLLDPRERPLMCAIAPVLSMNPDKLAENIQHTLANLLQTKNTLSSDVASRWSIGVHKALPFGSAIMLDENESYGKIQIETKPYKQPMAKSFAFEVMPTSSDGLFHSLRKGYLTLIDDGDEYKEGGIYQPRKNDR